MADMTTDSQTGWDFYFPSKEAAYAATEGPFYDLGDGVLFPGEVEIAAKPKGSDGPYVKLCLEIDADVGKVVCAAFEVRRAAGGVPIEASTISHIKLKPLLDAAAVWESANARAIVDIEGGVRGEDGRYVFNRDDTHDTEKNALALRRQRSVTDDLLREVAAVYQADTIGAPTLAVEDHFETSNRTATRWVKLARQRGFIPRYTRVKKED